MFEKLEQLQNKLEKVKKQIILYAEYGYFDYVGREATTAKFIQDEIRRTKEDIEKLEIRVYELVKKQYNIEKNYQPSFSRGRLSDRCQKIIRSEWGMSTDNFCILIEKNIYKCLQEG